MAFEYDPFPVIQRLVQASLDTVEDAEAKKRRIGEAIDEIGRAYRAGRVPNLQPVYHRLAYCIQYLPIGLAMVRRLCRGLANVELPKRLSIFNDAPVRVVSVGAGPGTDLFGLLSSMAVAPFGVTFSMLDAEQSWMPVFRTFRKDFSEAVPELTAVVQGMTDEFIQIDLEATPLRADARTAIGRADIILVHRVSSSFQDNPAQIGEIIRHITDEAHDGALLFVLDVAIPGSFEEVLAMTEGYCRQAKGNSHWLLRHQRIEQAHFGYHIPQPIMELEEYSQRHITRSGRYLGGVVWLKD